MPKRFKWARWKGYECSSKGDSRYSAFYAYLADGKSIEYHYQVHCKGYNSITEGKGKPTLNGQSRQELYEEYKELWRQWAKDNQELMIELAELASEEEYTLSDRFATTNINQARALCDLLNEMHGF